MNGCSCKHSWNDHHSTGCFLCRCVCAGEPGVSRVACAPIEIREDERRNAHRMMLEWRGIKEACLLCGGTGRITYDNATTWHTVDHLRGTQTDDVCNKCWGTGDRNRKGVNLKVLSELALAKDLCELAKRLRHKSYWLNGMNDDAVSGARMALDNIADVIDDTTGENSQLLAHERDPRWQPGNK